MQASDAARPGLPAAIEVDARLIGEAAVCGYAHEVHWRLQFATEGGRGIVTLTSARTQRRVTFSPDEAPEAVPAFLIAELTDGAAVTAS